LGDSVGRNSVRGNSSVPTLNLDQGKRLAQGGKLTRGEDSARRQSQE
jgi:hypothetical protein